MSRVQSGRRWAGAQCDQPCLGFGGRRLRMPNMDSGKAAFLSHVLRLALVEPQGAIAPGSDPLRRG